MYLTTASSLAIALSGCVVPPPNQAQPAQNIDPYRHPNLARAQQQIASAYRSIVAAQNANQYQLGGHADHAKQLLSEAADELKAAALTANAEGR
ncbi:hypothetical protein [Burkholderia oklahomensis]|uniref:hypothetical protein n=1 Tax=Burkholderia oklahomensis TaxID=342113 RepID=UPI002657FA4E|nr:hypothetical protein [Burkholderia oklahomensis]